ncbi:MAG: peptidoglycan editing factor PgeF [Rhodobacteraceae bacterium]|nr:peptidoglycan editing factor PgeF [Paracoccaceae bacterium]
MTLEILTSANLAPVRHGFFTRAGGASSGIFAGLNCGFGSSDHGAVVRLNRAMVAEAMGVEAAKLTGVHQVHSAAVVHVTSDTVADWPKADAMVTADAGIALSVLAADCAPVLFADAAAGVIGAAHCGWRGAFYGVLGSTVTAMRALGADRIRATIGPCISWQAYEVGPEFFDRFRDEASEFARFFVLGQNGRFRFDLPGFCLARLRDHGVDAYWMGLCTYSDEAHFFSCRRATHRSEADYGRGISAICL